MSRLVVATSNRHKLREIADLLHGAGGLGDVEVLSPADLGRAIQVVENADSFAGNARLKAEAAARATGELVLADDSGLCVDALDGAPGVHSARFAARHGRGMGDAANRALLLQMLQGVPPEGRTAHFVCAVALAEPGRQTVVFTGRVSGRIALSERGREGFGYDPLFEVDGGRTFAELPLAEKQALSHRGRALRAALPEIARRLRST